MRKFSKSIVKEFQTGFGRFVAIMAIIALGVGFLIGIMQATPDMKRTMDGHYRENVAYDADIKGVYGLTQEDVDQIAALDEVESVTPIISTDVLVSGESSERVGRIIGLDRLHAEENLNRLTLVEGKWPRRGSNEVVAVHGSKKFDSIQVGDEFTLQVDDSTYGNVYKNETIRVVGIVSSIDYYYGDAREVSSLGTGVVGAVFFAASLGFGVLASSVFVFVFQGAIVLLAQFVEPFLSDSVIAEMTCVGSLLLIGMAFNLIGIAKLKIMDFIPAIFLPILLVPLFDLF